MLRLEKDRIIISDIPNAVVPKLFNKVAENSELGCRHADPIQQLGYWNGDRLLKRLT